MLTAAVAEVADEQESGEVGVVVGRPRRVALVATEEVGVWVGFRQVRREVVEVPCTDGRRGRVDGNDVSVPTRGSRVGPPRTRRGSVLLPWTSERESMCAEGSQERPRESQKV